MQAESLAHASALEPIRVNLIIGRARARLSQEDLAERSAVGRDTISRIERGAPNDIGVETHDLPAHLASQSATSSFRHQLAWTTTNWLDVPQIAKTSSLKPEQSSTPSAKPPALQSGTPKPDARPYRVRLPGYSVRTTLHTPTFNAAFDALPVPWPPWPG